MQGERLFPCYAWVSPGSIPLYRSGAVGGMSRIAVSFSGGKTSAYMAWWMKHNVDAELCYVFANTGQEHEKTLEFVDRCDKEWGLDVAWIEAEVHFDKRKGSTHREVDFYSASRRGRPFERVIRKYGIPNHSYPHCTRELKANPIKSYLDQKWGKGYEMAVGIRIDEIDRQQVDAKQKGIIYPLISMHPADKAKVNRFWDTQPFALDLEPRLGNCTWCWKKTLRKHLTNIEDYAEIYDFPERMEAMYGTVGSAGRYEGQRVFFRGNRSVQDLKALAALPFERWREEYTYDLFSDMDMPSGCSESCEVEL